MTTINNPQRQQLRVEVPMYVSQPLPQMRVKVAVEDGALVLTVRRQDGQPITDQGPTCQDVVRPAVVSDLMA